MKYTPTSLKDRIEALDMLRGFALLGIFIANMLLFHTPYLYIDPYTYFTTATDIATFKWIAIFIQSSFYPIFAFLFGYGINMQYEKSIEKNLPFSRMMRKRLAILLLFGLVHSLFVWSGDVLFTYAALGFLLIVFVRLPAGWLAAFAVVLYTIPSTLLYLAVKFIETTDPDAFKESIGTTKIEQAIQVYGAGSFGEIFSFRAVEWLGYGLTSTFLGVFIVLPIIMLGAAISKWKVIERAQLLRKSLLSISVLSIGLGIWIKSLPFIKSPAHDLIQVQQTFGGVLLATGYVTLFLFLTTFDKIRNFFKPLGSAGRMSLTTYLTQSIIATMLFYAYGFGFYDKIDLWTGTGIAVGIFVIQVIFAEVWFIRFSMGPFEKLWRSWTYRKNSTK